jgi:hypothetical protein
MIGLPMVIQIAATMLHRTGERTTRSALDARTSIVRFTGRVTSERKIADEGRFTLTVEG